jgi:hypothetical protein
MEKAKERAVKNVLIMVILCGLPVKPARPGQSHAPTYVWLLARQLAKGFDFRLARKGLISYSRASGADNGIPALSVVFCLS